MSREYKIEAVMLDENDEPKVKEWSSAYGKLYQYRVKLGGFHDWVNLNKKPDSEAPKKDDDVYGDVTTKEWTNPETKETVEFYNFKSASRPEQATGQPKQFKPYEKDDTAVTLNMVWKNLLNVVGVPTNVVEKTKFWAMVQYHTEELLAMSKFNKTNVKEAPLDIPPTPPTADIHEKLEKGFTKEMSEEEANSFLGSMENDG
jgi:hypothetical protein